ncbi:hypothetical protein PHMEG_00018621 [Phytophthora megakarya]|uniref:Uncharacterized protein n=1 Tax=Phytophthora megakarya TaxID=4795 RepID=A0A225VV64_9STRA|nr:hypothetical protein PHMEG_00018621 [Phytophthora megakarya]
MITGIGEEVRGYRVYLTKDMKVVTSQRMRNIEMLNKSQNLQVQRLHQDEDEAEDVEESRARETKLNAQGMIERLKARLVASGNDPEIGLNYGVTFAAVIDMTNVKLILRVPANLSDVPNAYTYIHVPQGTQIPEENLEKLGVGTDTEVVLELKKALYGLKQTGRRTQQRAVDVFLEELKSLEIKDLGCACKFLGMRIEYSDDNGYDLDQKMSIYELLQAYGLEKAHVVRVPIGED